LPGRLTALVQSLLGTREGVLPSIQVFPPLDMERLARDLRLEDRAKENGTHNQPATEDEVEDATEGDIVAEIERRARKANEDYRSQLDLYDGRIRRALISTDARAAIDAAAKNALADFKVQSIEDLDHLYNARREVEGREEEFRAFRAAHRLLRLPKVVSSRERTLRTLVLAIFVVLESLLNGMFFAQGAQTGLIGGVTEALVLSLLNVSTAVLYARFGLPLLAHVRPAVKSIGVLATLLYAVLAVGINLSIGHYRDLFIHDVGQVSLDQLFLRLTSAPVALSDAKSLLLVALGLGLSIFSLIDASGMDDIYPGYGGIERRRSEAVLAYGDEKARCLAGLTDRRDTAIEDMSGAIELMRRAEYELHLAIEGRSALYENYRAYLEQHLSDAHVQMLRRYRESNVRARSTPPPARFHRRPPSLAFLTAPPPPKMPDLADDTKREVIARIERFIEEINQQFAAAARQYQTVSELAREGATHRGTA
jgi:hypothetical protein